MTDKPRYTPATGGPKQTAWIRERVAGELMQRTETSQRESDECFASFGLVRGWDVKEQMKERAA